MDRETIVSQQIDPNALMEVLIDLQIGIRKLSIYSHAHPVIPKIVSGLAGQFNELFKIIDAVPLGITRGEILYQGTPISKDNPVIQALAKRFHGLNLIGITFQKSLTKDDLLRFIKMIAEYRSPLITDRAQAWDRFREEVTSISLTFVSFKGAIGRQNETEASDHGEGIQAKGSGNDLWKDLVNKLSGDREQVEADREDNTAMDYALDPEHAAKVINDLFGNHNGERRGQEQEYEGVIVNYLHEHASKTVAGKERAAHMRKEMGKLFSNLRPDVREQIFRFSLNKNENDHLAMEGLLDSLPSAALPEVLNQIQVSDNTVSGPMFSLLKKLASATKDDLSLENDLKSKIGGHRELFNELFVDRSDRLYYPTEYRSLLDEGLDTEDKGEGLDSDPDKISTDSRETDYHLAIILLNMLEGPVLSEAQYSGCVDYILRLLEEGLANNSRKVLGEAIKIILKRHASGAETHQALFRRQISKFLKAEFISCLLRAESEAEREEEGNLIDDIIRVVRAELVPILLEILEEEEGLSVRKRLLALISGCGREGLPFVVKKLNSDKWYVIRNLLVLLRELQAKEVLPQITRFLKHDAAQVRLGALQAFGMAGADADLFYQALATSLEDSDPKVYKTAVAFLIPIHHPRAVDMVMEKLTDDDKHGSSKARQRYIIETIGETGGREWMAPLSRLKTSKTWHFWRWESQKNLQRDIEAAVAMLRTRTEANVEKTSASDK